MVNNLILIVLYFGHIAGIILWGHMALVLMEVVVCRDAKEINTQKLLKTPLAARLLLFKRSLKSLFYKASLGLFLGSLIAMMGMINTLWMAHIPRIIWVVVSILIPGSLEILYNHLGYRLTLYDKFVLFMKDEHN